MYTTQVFNILVLIYYIINLYTLLITSESGSPMLFALAKCRFIVPFPAANIVCKLMINYFVEKSGISHWEMTHAYSGDDLFAAGNNPYAPLCGFKY